MPARWTRITWFYALCWVLLLLVPALHALFFAGPMETPVYQATHALPQAAVAAILIALSGPELGRRR